MTNNTPTPFDWRSEFYQKFVPEEFENDSRIDGDYAIGKVTDFYKFIAKVEAATEERVRGEMIEIIGEDEGFPPTRDYITSERRGRNHLRAEQRQKLELLGEKGE